MTPALYTAEGPRSILRVYGEAAPTSWRLRVSDDAKKQTSVDDRRSQLGLRVLIDQMLQQVRELNRHAASWDPDERARAEQQLEMIMARVRDEAARGHTK